MIFLILVGIIILFLIFCAFKMGIKAIFIPMIMLLVCIVIIILLIKMVKKSAKKTINSSKLENEAIKKIDSESKRIQKTNLFQ